MIHSQCTMRSYVEPRFATIYESLMHGSKRLLSTVGTIRWWTIKMFHDVSVQYCRYFMQVVGKKTHAAGILCHIWDRDFELCVILYEVASTSSGWIRYDDRTAGCERQMVRPLHSQHWITFSVRNARRDKSRSELWTIQCTTQCTTGSSSAVSS